MTVTASTVDRLDLNFAELGSSVERAESALAAGGAAEAAAWLQTAATQAWLNPCGLFASTGLETLARRLAERVPETPGRPRPSTGVLHVVTQAYQTGGSTQYVACWMDQDPAQSHRVCLTRQGSTAVPTKFLARRSSTVDMTRIDGARGLLPRAARLRDLARRSELVVVHAHPHDAVAALAFSGVPDLPPVVYVNQADHVFWLGTGTLSTLLNMRASGAALARRRRGVEDDRAVVAARPLQPRGRALPRAEAKRLLGLRPDQVVVATVADGSKYRPLEGPSLLDLVLPMVRAEEDVVLLAAGPSSEGEWSEAGRSTGGRVRALGLLDDPSLVQQAADVYLDSYPFSSLTSLLETGSLGTPVVTYAGHPEGCEVLGADTPGVEEQMFTPSTGAELRRVLHELAHDAGLRERSGRAIATCIADTHVGAGWQRELGKVLDHAAHSPGPGALRPVSREVEPLDRLALAVMDRTGHSGGRPGAIRDNLGLFPLPARVRLSREVLDAGVIPVAKAVVPEQVRAGLARAHRRSRALLAGGSSTGQAKA